MAENKLSGSLLYVMAIGAGLVVANNYYNQPLLNLMAKTFQVSEAEVSNIPLFTQLGYAFGLLFIIPLGDKFNRKKLILIDFIAIIGSLLVAAISPSLLLLTIASFCIGFSSVVPQLFVPMAAQLANPKNKGRAIGIVMSGLLIGILGSRSVSGYVGEYLGWRNMYFIASGIMLVYAIVLVFQLPSLSSDFKGSYSKLMQSLWTYFKSESSVRLAAVRGGLGFAGFSAFWTTLVFLMEDNFNYGSGITGLFGILGIAGALAATWAGKLSDKMNKNRLITIATLVMILAWGVFEFSGESIVGLVIGVVFIDMGLQSLHITNQNIIFSKNPEARNRINTIYMVGYFIGGALGTTTGAYAWQWFQWEGVASLGLIYTILILLVHLIFKQKNG
ncbi:MULTISPECIES: MFS transporter [Mesonia]|uniref:Transporter n=1 Tax=Mesonia oceanica TaxID=2687242 RepID=A0AC61Y6C5_9FLAO|nr:MULTISPECIES: MFS transporter [Mesonia]MAN26323.1 MFS transporter [Mesonia sp.]MAQ42265.1 MFS transporter [Mesonia sp.]MBJ98551.1 MFS transporter [Flavobacteriaceae bacterium]VVV00034.1 putative transporter [Mesonia oceanica]|tara:strand:+ start:8610 stop:9776 length:1167 start_codon:yes stop_codon:yes gene_type:complete